MLLLFTPYLKLQLTVVDVQTETLIDKPLPEVAAYAANPDNAPKWYVNIKSVEWKSPKPLAVGSRIAFHARFLGRTLEYTYEIIEYIPDRKLIMRTAEGPFPMQTTYTWEPVDTGRTRMTLRNNGEPSGFSKIAAPMIEMMMRRANTKDLKRIKTLLEGEIS